MISYIAPALYGIDLYALGLEERLREEEMIGPGVASQSDDRRMFAENESVRPGFRVV
jgi:hypothetical protein